MNRSLVVRCDDPGALARARERLAGRAGWTELPLIQGAAVSLPEQDVALLEGLEVAPDESVEVPRDLPGDPVHAQLQTAVPSLKAPELWQQGFKGKGVTVAVVDTGISRHRDFAGRILAFQDQVGGKSDPYDDHGHGSHVAGIVAGDGTDSKGKYVGVAPECSVVAIKAFDREGKAKVSDLIKAIQWAVENRERYHIQVLNLSARGKANLSYKVDPLVRAVEAAYRQGILTVIAAGNDGPDRETIGTPGHSPVVLTVGASDDRGTVDRQDDRVAGLSSRGPTPVDGLPKPDVVAPGVDVTATSNFSKGYVTKSGTSMAAPMVSGLAALLLCARPESTPDQLKTALVDSAEKLPRGGDANSQGHGLVDGPAALALLQAGR